MEEGFVREFYIDSTSKTLKLHQKLEGDVNCVVWDSSIVLAKYLEKLCENQANYFENLSVIELGAGVGCVGLMAASLGYVNAKTKNLTSKFNRADVVLTDLPEALPLLTLNINCNKSNWQTGSGSAQAVPLIWGHDLENKRSPDIIVLADCIYYEQSIDKLVKTLRELASNETVVILSQEMRDSERQKKCWKYFTECVANYFNLYYVPSSEQNADYQSPDIVLLRLTKL